MEFYRSLAFSLDLEPQSKKIDLFRAIQERIVSLAKEKRIIPTIIIDESQYLKTEVLNDIKLLMNFDMDSKNYSIFILNGQQTLNSILSKQVHEALRQRIVISYNFQGISKSKMESFASSRLAICGCHVPIYNQNTLEALYSCCGGSTRKLNSIIEKCLLIGSQQKVRVIDTEIVMAAQNETELIS